MARFILGELKFGDEVHDMHYGDPSLNLAALFGPGVGITTVIRSCIPGGCAIITTMLVAHRLRHEELVSPICYTNKMLVLVGRNHVAGKNRYLFAYSYDNTTLGFIEVEKSN